MGKTKPITDEVRERILTQVRRRKRPMLIGTIALELKCSLYEAEHWLMELLYEGRLRKATAAEKSEYDILEGFVLV